MPAGQSKTFVVQQMLQMVIKKLINNMFRMDMCDNICKLIIVPRRVTFTSEHRTSKTEQSNFRVIVTGHTSTKIRTRWIY